jgi:hypothetical protein
LVNIFWFFREAFLVPAYTEQSQIKGCEFRKGMREASGWWQRMVEALKCRWSSVGKKKGLVWAVQRTAGGQLS